MLNFLFTYTPLSFLTQSFWRDEAFTYLLAKKNILDIMVLTAKDFNPPLYYVLIHLWMKVFGSSEISLRSFSLIFFWATLYVCLYFLLDIFKFTRKKGYLYLLLLLINPLLTYFAFEARMYTFFAFLATLSFYSFYKKKDWLYFISTLLGLYTHYFMLLVLASQFVFTLIANRINRDAKIEQKKILKPFLYFIPWFIFAAIQGKFDSSFWIEKITISTFFKIPAILYTGFEQGMGFFAKYFFLMSLFLIAPIIIAIIKNKRVNKEKTHLYLYLIIWSLGTSIFVAILSFFKPLFLPRYLIFSGVGFILLIIYSLEHLRRNARILALVILTCLTLYFQKLQLEHRGKEDLRIKIKEIKLLAKKDDLLYVTDILDFHTAQYYFGDDRVFIYNKTYEEIPEFVGKILISKDKIKESLPSYPIRAFILNHNGDFVVQALF